MIKDLPANTQWRPLLQRINECCVSRWSVNPRCHCYTKNSESGEDAMAIITYTSSIGASMGFDVAFDQATVKPYGDVVNYNFFWKVCFFDR